MLPRAHHSFGLGEWDIEPISLPPSYVYIYIYIFKYEDMFNIKKIMIFLMLYL